MPQIRDTKYKIQILTYLLHLFLWLFLVTPTMAATLSISGIEGLVVNQSFTVDIALITLGEQLNAVEAEVLYDPDMLRLEGIREDSSAIGLWLQKPQKTDDGKVVFSGVIPGGSPSARTHLVTLVFLPLRAGEARVWIPAARAFLNDGAATEVPLSFLQYQGAVVGEPPRVSLNEQSEENNPLMPEDHASPEPFLPEVSRNEHVFDGKWFLAFSAIDKGSGVEYYDIFESRYKIQNTKYEDIGGWVRTESPYLLIDQELKSYIYVKAVDQAGNEYVAVVEPHTKANWLLWIVLSVIGGVLVVLWRYKKRFNET